jgi:hypothetical protein
MIAAILMKTFNLRFPLFAIVVLFPFLVPSPAFCLESADQLLKELDAHYYYPQKQGLKKLAVRVEWEQLDVITDSGKYLKNPPVEFLWKKTRAGSKSAFELAKRSHEISDERKKELLNTLENYKDIVIPQTLTNKLANYKGKVKATKKKKTLIEFVSPEPVAGVKKYNLVADLKNKAVRSFRIERSQAPFKVISMVRYSREEGKWLIAESRSKFRVGEMDYIETTEYFYRKVGKMWLVSKMTQTLKMDDRILQSYIFRFRDYKIN